MNREEFYEALNRNREYALEHHGIKGQKWGLRRFQNPDGTLTPAGRARYLKALSNYQKAAGSRDYSVAGSAVKSGLLGAGAGFGISAFEGGTTDQATVSALLSGGASAIAGASVSAIKNKIKDAKLNKAVAIMQEFKAMYGDKSVDEVTRDKYGNLLTDRIKFDNSSADDQKAFEDRVGQVINEVSQPGNNDFHIVFGPNGQVYTVAKKASGSSTQTSAKSNSGAKASRSNGKKYDMEFLESFDTGHLSDAQLDKLYKKYENGASWDTLYEEAEKMK